MGVQLYEARNSMVRLPQRVERKFYLSPTLMWPKARRLSGLCLRIARIEASQGTRVEDVQYRIHLL